ncbi:GcrA cell cycle regulator [compost metagenome]
MSESVWTIERTRRLAALWRQGFTAADIAARLGHGISRCAVLGKVHRLGLMREPLTRPKRRRSDKPGGGAALTGTAEASAVAPGRLRLLTPLAPKSDPPAAPESPLATILSVRRGQCRWPCEAPGAVGFGLCGRPVARGAFCAGHAALGYQARPATAEGLMRLADLDQAAP